MSSDFVYIFDWWFTFFLVGLAFLPLTTKLFNKFWDQGYAFAKVIGPTAISFIALVLGILHLLPFSRLSIVGLSFSVFFINLAIVQPSEFIKTLKKHKWIFMAEELMFFLILTAWSYVRGFAPDIEGLEKYMDWGFVNSILRTKYFPPADMWFAGSPINYYYFGHLIIAVMTKLSDIGSAITYNLAIASTCALTFTTGFSIASNFISQSAKKINRPLIVIGGVLAAFFLTFGGNLHTYYKIGANIIKDNGKLVLTQAAIKKASNAYWYPDATRFIGFDPDTKDKTIHEFPIYSFVVSDLHGHMNDIPIVILIVAFLYAIYPLTLKKNLNPVLFVTLGLLLSTAYMTNAWDFAVYGLLFAFTFFFFNLSSGLNFLTSATKTITHGFLTIVFWFIFSAPFSLNFTPMTEGLRLSDAHSPFYQLFVLYGGFWLVVLPLVLFILVKVFRKKFSELNSTDFFILGLVITATVLIILPEIGYIKDIYIYEHRRANTMFKLVYQAFIIYSLCTGYCLIRLKKYLAYNILFALIFVVQLTYPYFAIKGYYNFSNYYGLYGLNYLKNLYPDNYAAVQWMNENISGQPYIVEAAGDSYTTFDQISVATGLPTVEGWIVHEWLWRGGYDKPAARQTDVANIYQSTDLKEVKSLLQKYDVKYIFVGAKEYEKFPDLDTKRFVSLGAKEVYSSGQTEIFELN